MCIRDRIHGDIKQHDTTIVFHSGTKLVGDEYVTNGGRVLGVVGLGKDLRTALDRAYGRIEPVSYTHLDVYKRQVVLTNQ